MTAMKKIALFAILLASISLAFIGCEPKQSEMDLSVLTDTATISGALVYDAGVDTAGSADQYAINQIKPVANRVIYVEIPYASYNFNAEQKGSKIYETVTDLDGNFTISVPTTSTGLKNVTVRMQEFTAYKSEYKKMDGSNPVFETDLYRYEWVKENITLKPGSIDFLTETERKCTETKVTIEELTETITLTGNIQLAYEAGFRKGIYKAAANATVEFEAEYPEGFDGVLTAGTVTDGQGNYRITLPLKSYKDGFSSLSVKVLGLAGDPYVHYSTATDKQTLAGAYVAEDVLSLYSGASEFIEGVEHKMKTMYLRFTPGYTNNLANEVTPSTYTSDLVGWEKYDGFTETITFTGKYLLAASAGYGVGTYTNKTGEGLFLVDYGDALRGSKYLFAPVNEDGTFSFELPVTDKEEKFKVISAYDNAKEFRYAHYKNEKDIVEITGTYAPYEIVTELGAEWNDLGTTYFTFNPSSSITPEQLNDIDWNPNLVGWFVDPDKKETVTLKANLYLPTEKEFAVGNYVAANGYIFTVTVDGDNFAAPVKSGKFEIGIPVENQNKELAVSFASSDIEDVYDYVHYTSANGDKQTLNGKYVKRIWLGEDKADRKVWNELGDVYFKFVPDAAYDLAKINWNNNLADWIKSVDKKYVAKETVKVNFAVESAFGKGEYVPANGIIAEISDGDYTYAAPVKSGKVEFNVLKRDEFEVANYTWNPNTLKYEVDNFLHFYDGVNASAKRYLEGAYNDYSKEEAEDCLYVVHLKFTPDAMLYSSDELTKMNWFSDLAGWVYDSKLKVTKTVTGSIQRAIETGFRAGTFTAAAFEKVTVNVNGTNFIGVTDVDGNYSIDVRMQYDERPSTFSVTDEVTTKVYKFNHYRRPDTGDIEEIKVKYSGSFTDHKEGIDAWNTRKTKYYKISTHDPVDYWSNNLAGWINREYQVVNGFKTALTIKGQAMRAVEAKDGSDWTAEWEADKYRLIQIQVAGRTYDLVANGSGNYTLSVALEEVGTDYNVRVIAQPSLDDQDKVINFKHYPQVDKAAYNVLIGRFQDANVIDGISPLSVTSNTIEVKNPSLKSIFVPNVIPSDGSWYNYDWAAIIND